MNPKHPSIAVIGGGIIGSWTALHLVEAGVSTTLFEQFPLPHTRGSSHGLSRAFRFLGELEMDRLDYSLERWLDLEEVIGEILFVKTGLLNFGPPGDADLELYMKVLRESQRPFEWLDSKSIAARFPMLSYPDKWGAAWDPNGGILIAHRCLNAVQSQFIKRGGKLVTGQVLQLKANGAGVSLSVQTGLIGATTNHYFDIAVLCAGPWTAKLLPRLGKILHSVRTPVTYWRDLSEKYSVSNGSPITSSKSSQRSKE